MSFTFDTDFDDLNIAVLVPCLNEAATVEKVVSGFKTCLPNSKIFVYDNASTDGTADLAYRAGATVRLEETYGKGRVVRRMFAEIDADFYVLIDGDGTYEPSEVTVLLKKLLQDNLDMVVGCRTLGVARTGHMTGNKIFNRLYKWLFGSGFTDIFSGYRVISRRFINSFPAVSTGFEIETEMSVHASQLNLPIAEVDVSYRDRPEGSESKLRTFSDGWRILRAMGSLLKDNRPMILFNFMGGFFILTATLLGLPLVIDFVDTGIVKRLPTAVLSTGLALVGSLLLVLGFLLDVIAKTRLEAKRLVYLQNR